MRTSLSATLAAVITLAGLSSFAAALQAEPRVRYVPPPQGVGCYFYRGVRYCSRYCYWEVDGYRYCQRRPEEAVSQAPYLILVEPEPLPRPLK